MYKKGIKVIMSFDKWFIRCHRRRSVRDEDRRGN